MRSPRVSAQSSRSAWLLELGVEPYESILDLQRRLARSRQRDEIGDGLILLEHAPVITLGRRANESHILASSDVLREAGISVHRVERGGDVTYHGPGQIVGYPILRLTDHGLGVSDYMHLLEEVIVRVLADLGLTGTRREHTIGVWLGDNKVAAFGARVEKGVTYHGFALNVRPNLKHYDLIVPCGITDGGVTSIRSELGEAVDLAHVRQLVRHWFSELFDVRLVPVATRELQTTIEMTLTQ